MRTVHRAAPAAAYRRPARDTRNTACRRWSCRRRRKVGLTRIADGASGISRCRVRAALSAVRSDNVLDQLGSGPGRSRRPASRARCCRASRPRRAEHGRRARLALARHGRGGSFGAPGQAEPVHLADHGVTGDPAEFAGNLACRERRPTISSNAVRRSRYLQFGCFWSKNVIWALAPLRGLPPCEFLSDGGNDRRHAIPCTQETVCRTRCRTLLSIKLQYTRGSCARVRVPDVHRSSVFPSNVHFGSSRRQACGNAVMLTLAGGTDYNTSRRRPARRHISFQGLPSRTCHEHTAHLLPAFARCRSCVRSRGGAAGSPPPS